MNTQKATASTAAAAPPPRPKASTGMRSGKPQAPFTPPSRDGTPAEPTLAEPTDALSLLSKMMGATAPMAAPLSPGAVPRALQPPPAGGGDPTKGLLQHAGDPVPDALDGRSRSITAHEDPLDPMLRQTAQFGPPLSTQPLPTPTSPEAAVTARAMTSLEELLPQLVRKIAWSGDGKRGAVRMELGAGALAGSTLMLESDRGRVRVHLDTPPGVDGQAWKQRIGARLAEKNIDVESIEVQ
jgi:hypothetical protein